MLQDPIIVEVQFSPSRGNYHRSVRFDDLDEAQVEADRLFDEASKALRPKVLFRELFIDRHETVDALPSVTIGEQRFIGKALYALEDVHRVIAYVATCGSGMESFDPSSWDMLAPYWLDSIKNQALGAARRRMLEYCKERFGIAKPLSLNPGSGNVDIWPIEQMQGLFSLLGGSDLIGVKLTESSLMVPNKTIAGLLFASASTDYESCAYCERPQCPNRRVPFKQVL